MKSYEQLLLANTFSKNWAMTGWRLGWLVVPPAMLPRAVVVYFFIDNA